MVRVEAAYGLFYLDNRPALLRALELPSPPTGEPERLLNAAAAHGFNAVRPWPGLARETAASFGMALLDLPVPGGPVAGGGPFGVSLRAARATAAASDDQPAALWGLSPNERDLAAAVARGIRAYSVALDEATLFGQDLSELARFQAWLATREEELTASVEVRDALAYLDYPPYNGDAGADALHGAHAMLALAGYNPTLVNLEEITDAEIGEFPGGVFPSRGFMELEDYGKLVVFTLRGGTLVTYPVPVRTQPSGAPFKSTFLWPRDPEPPPHTWRDSLSRLAGRSQPAVPLGYTAQVRDGTSTLLATNFGEPYAGPAYMRLPRAQRLAHRELALSLFESAVPRTLVPDPDLEVELVARLSPDGGALLFVVNRLDRQAGHVRLAVPEALNVGTPPVVETLFAARGSTATWEGDALSLIVQSGDALILRLT